MNPEKLNRNSKILNISHYDFDGVSCAIALSNYFKNVICRSSSLKRLDKILETWNFDGYDAVFITDCSPNNMKLLENPKIICLDHHPHAETVNNPNVYSIPNNCAAVLTKNYIESMYDFDLSHLNTLMKYTNDYDLWIHNYKKTKMVEILFWNYGFDQFRNRFMNGDVRFTRQEIDFIRMKMNEFKKIYDELEIYEFSKIKGCLIFTDSFINDLADTLIYKDGYSLVTVCNSKSNHVSVRINKNSEYDIGKILTELDIGGGHPKAAGLRTDNLPFEEVQLNITKLENYLVENNIFTL